MDYETNRTKGVIDAIAEVGTRTRPIEFYQDHNGSIEGLVDTIDDLLATQEEYANKYPKEEGRFTGYHHTLKLLQSLCHLTGRE